MILYFRTERNASGNCKFLALDTGAQTYATQPSRWISKDIPALKARDLETIRQQLEHNEWTRIANM